MVIVDVFSLLFDRTVGDDAFEVDLSSTEMLRLKSWWIIAAATATGARPPLLLNCTLMSPSSVDDSLNESFDDLRLLCSISSSGASFANSGGGGGIISLVGLDFGDDLLLSGFSLEISSSPCSTILRLLGSSAMGVGAFSCVGVGGSLIAAAAAKGGGSGAGPFSRLMTYKYSQNKFYVNMAARFIAKKKELTFFSCSGVVFSTLFSLTSFLSSVGCGVDSLLSFDDLHKDEGVSGAFSVSCDCTETASSSKSSGIAALRDSCKSHQGHD